MIYARADTNTWVHTNPETDEKGIRNNGNSTPICTRMDANICAFACIWEGVLHTF